MNPFVSVVFAALFVSQGAFSAGDAARIGMASPMSQLERSADALRASLRRTYPSWSPEAELQRSTVERIVAGSVDYREFGRRTLGGHWKGLSEADRATFVAELGRLIENRCLAREDFGSEFKIRFEREAVSSRGTASVFATALGNARRKLRVSIEYRLLWEADHWSIYDLVTDGESLVDSYRDQFDRILGRESFQGLLERLKHQADLR